MTSDTFLNLSGESYADLQRQYNARGFTGVSYEMNRLRLCQSWRLFQGAEPSAFLSSGSPAVHMRYGPYRTTP